MAAVLVADVPLGLSQLPLSNPVFDVVAAAVLVVVVLLLVFVVRLIRTWVRLHRSARPGKARSSEVVSDLPQNDFRRDGAPGDPINVVIVGSEAQLGAAFASAGWYRADEITFLTSLRITFDSIFAREYSTAPVSNQYLYGRRQDVAFEQPGKSVRERDHARFWKTGQQRDQRDVWVGAATRDIRVALSPKTHLPTHLIERNVDHERDFLADDLAATGWIIDQHTMTLGSHQLEHRKGGDGYEYETDGAVVTLTLADVPAPLIAQQIRSRVAANFIKRVLAPILQRRLPKAGRDRAHHVRQRRAREVAAK